MFFVSSQTLQQEGYPDNVSCSPLRYAPHHVNQHLFFLGRHSRERAPDSERSKQSIVSSNLDHLLLQIHFNICHFLAVYNYLVSTGVP